jgi:MYXO-CTERM domain-containing protein
MKAIRTLAGLAIAIVLPAVPSAKAAILLSDNFDSYADQAAFNAAWPNVATPNVSGTLSTLQAVSLPNSVNYQTSAQRNERTFAESGTPTAANPITFSFDFFDTNGGLAPYRQYTDIQDGASPSLGGQLIAMGLNNNMTITADGGNYYMARVLGYDGAPGVSGGGASAFFKLNQGLAPTRTTGWHNLKAVITDTQITFFVDGILSATEITNVAATRSYDLTRLGSGLSAAAQAYFDNISIDNEPAPPVPEPASMVLLALGGLALVRRRAR